VGEYKREQGAPASAGRVGLFRGGADDRAEEEAFVVKSWEIFRKASELAEADGFPYPPESFHIEAKATASAPARPALPRVVADDIAQSRARDAAPDRPPVEVRDILEPYPGWPSQHNAPPSFSDD
jgi:hypothetical protein